MDLTWVKTIEILMVVKTFAASIAQTLVDKQEKFQILSYKLGPLKKCKNIFLSIFRLS
jgi:hypothetical protein